MGGSGGDNKDDKYYDGTTVQSNNASGMVMVMIIRHYDVLWCRGTNSVLLTIGMMIAKMNGRYDMVLHYGAMVLWYGMEAIQAEISWCRYGPP